MTRPIAIVGPTGTGKSALALAVARAQVGGEVVNADAMQLYRGMDIGTAKLAVAERRGIPHHQLDVLDVTETATVARYQQAAAADIEAIAGRGAVPILVGGSMLYVQSLLDEWSFPATDPRCGPDGSGGSPRSASAHLHGELAARRRRRGRVDPAHRRPSHRARAGGGRADGPAVRRVGARRSVRRDGTPRSSDWIGTPHFSTNA